MGNNFSGTGVLAEPDTFLAERLAPISDLAMLGQDAFPVFAVIVIVIDVPMLGRILS
jgi:hypothetical protein